MEYTSKIYLKLIPKQNNCHFIHNEIIAAFVYDFKTKEKTYFNFKHNDLPKNGTFEEFKKSLEDLDIKIFVKNKKNYKYWINHKNLIDANIIGFVENNTILDDINTNCTSYFQNNYHNINDFNLIVPYVKHQEHFDLEIKQIQSLYNKDIESYCFKFFNNIASETLYEVEKNGLKIDNDVFKEYFKARTYKDFVFTEYNLYNPTGRPSNKYDNINYVALNKEDGCRKSFVSRYEGGYLMMVDFTGFHPYIVSNLIDYKVPDDETIYEHLAKKYYNVETVDSNTLSKAKKLTMVNLYGQIKDQYLSIPFFAKTDELKDTYWSSFEKHGFVMTPLYKRKITNNHIIDPNKNKLFSYIIQATETEYGLNSLNNVIKYLSDKPMLPILYIYDSILFDVSADISEQTIQDVVDIIKNKKFKVKVYKGNNYNDLKLIKS